MNQSIDAYYQVLNLAPLQVSIRLALASALKSVGRDEEALTVLSGKISYFGLLMSLSKRSTRFYIDS